MVFRGQSTKYKCLENFALYGSRPQFNILFFRNGNHLDFNGTVLVNADLIVLFTVRPKEFNLISFHKPLDPILVAFLPM